MEQLQKASIVATYSDGSMDVMDVQFNPTELSLDKGVQLGEINIPGLDAPLLVSEFSPGGAGAAERPNMFGWYWSKIRAHPKRVIGGVVYTWTTRGPEDLDRVFGLTDPSGAPVDGSIAALRHLFQEDTIGHRNPR